MRKSRKFLFATIAATTVLGVPGLALAQSGHAAQAAYGINGDGQKIAFTDEERMIMRRYVHPLVPSPRVTTGAARNDLAVIPGDRIPDSVALRPFPAAVYHEAPELGAYRYIRIGTRDFVVDPRNRLVIEEIER